MIQFTVTLPDTAQLTLFGPPVVHSVLPMDVYTLPEGLYLHFEYDYAALPTSVRPRESEALGLGENEMLPGVMVRRTEAGGLCAYGENIAPRVLAALTGIAPRLRLLLDTGGDEIENVAAGISDGGIRVLETVSRATASECGQQVADADGTDAP